MPRFIEAHEGSVCRKRIKIMFPEVNVRLCVSYLKIGHIIKSVHPHRYFLFPTLDF